MYQDFDTITKPYRPAPWWKITIKTVLYLLLIVIVSTAFIYLASHYAKPVHGTSMQPTLNAHSVNDQDIVLVNKFAEPKHGDIVILDISSIPSEYTQIYDTSKSLLIKRVIAVGGDRIRMTYDSETHSTIVYLNGTPLQEEYVLSSASTTNLEYFTTQQYWQTKLEQKIEGSNEITIPEGMIFCMGDNRDGSKDCRFFGPVSLDTFQGVVDSILPDGSFGNSILSWLFSFA